MGRFVFQEDHAGYREGSILEVDKTKDKKLVGDSYNIQARKNSSLEEYCGNGNRKKWSESRDILEAKLTMLGNGLNMREKRKVKDSSKVSGSGYWVHGATTR